MKHVRGRINSSTTVDVLVENGMIDAIEPADLSHPCDAGSFRNYIAPGFVDLQINGYAGVDWNAEGLTPQALESAVRQLWSTGVAAFCPTIVTAAPDRIESRLVALAQAVESSRLINRSV